METKIEKCIKIIYQSPMSDEWISTTIRMLKEHPEIWDYVFMTQKAIEIDLPNSIEHFGSKNEAFEFFDSMNQKDEYKAHGMLFDIAILFTQYANDWFVYQMIRKTKVIYNENTGVTEVWMVD
jgi:5-methylcytosine-specific restriction endonuclease McrBC regulatory subunit McrC